MRRLWSWCILLTLLAAGCRLDPPVYPDVLDITAADTSTYLPTDKKANWEYEVDHGGSVTTENHFLSGEVIALDGKDYFTVTVSPGTQEEIRYFGKANGLYRVRLASPVNKEFIELQYLTDDAVLGDNWMADINAEKTYKGKPARTETTIRETDLTRTVQKKRYTAVTHTMVEVQHDTGDGMKTFGVYHFYVAKGIGIIEMTADFENETLATWQLKNFRLK